jgi:hypothetical protein
VNTVDQKYLPLFCLLAAIIVSSLARAGVVENIQVLKISAQDERAVIKTPDGKMQIIKIGDSLGDHERVLEIAANRVVIEEKSREGTEKVIIRLVKGKQKVERLRKTVQQSSPLLSPADNNQKLRKTR